MKQSKIIRFERGGCHILSGGNKGRKRSHEGRDHGGFLSALEASFKALGILEVALESTPKTPIDYL